MTPAAPLRASTITRPHRLVGAATCAVLLAASITISTAPASGAPADERRPAVVGLSITEIGTLLTSRQTTSVALVQEYLSRVNAYEDAYADQPGINAVIALNEDAVAQAAALDQERAAGRVRGPLHGVPLVIKDNFDTADMPTTAGSASLADFRPADDATQVQRLREAGAIILAKTNMSEFAWGYTGLSSQGGQTRNPFDQSYVPGGSSSGTGAGIAAGYAAAGLGSDTCGSIRVPAANNALVGLRPTLGLSSRDGVAPMSTTQDTAGPLALTVSDIALLLDATVGFDPKDPVTADSDGAIPETYLSSLTPGALETARIGLITNPAYLNTVEGAPVTSVVYQAADELRALGAEVVEVALPDALLAEVSGSSVLFDEFERELNTWLAQPGATFSNDVAALAAPSDTLTLSDIVADATADPGTLSLLTRADGMPDLPNPAYDAKLQRREAAKAALGDYLVTGGFDALAYPSLSREPVVVGGGSQPGVNCALAANTGFPAITIPAGRIEERGLPVGLELLGMPYSEPDLLALAFDFEQGTAHGAPAPSTPELVGAKSFASMSVSAPAAREDTAPTLSVSIEGALGDVVEGSVTLAVGGLEATSPIVDGSVVVELPRPLPAGDYTAVARYPGTATVHPVEASADLTVLSVLPSDGPTPPPITETTGPVAPDADGPSEAVGVSVESGGAARSEPFAWHLLPFGAGAVALLGLLACAGRQFLRRSASESS